MQTLHAFEKVISDLKRSSPITKMVFNGVITTEEIAYGLLIYDKLVQQDYILDDFFIVYTCIIIGHKVLQDCSERMSWFAKRLNVPLKALNSLEKKILQKINYDTHIEPINWELAHHIILSH